MICRSCSKEIPDNSAFCLHCGKKQAVEKSVKKRGNGQGSIYKRGNSWYVAITLGYYMENGKRKRKVRKKGGFERKKDAIAYVEQLRAQKQKPASCTFQTLWEKFQADLESLSKSKQDAYRIAWKKICTSIQFREVNEPTVSELQELIDLKGTSYYTKRDMKMLLSHLYKIALMDDIADKNRAPFLKLGELNSAEREVFTEDEINQLWKAYADGSMIAGHMLIMLYTGIRPKELLTIKSENVNLDEHWMTGGVKTEKSKRRKIIIPDCIEPVIRDSLSHSKKGLLAWYSHKTDFYDDWNALKISLSMREALSPYCCRHTYITRLTALNVSPAMLQELAGHEDYETTLNYTHLSVEDRREQVNKLLHPCCTQS